MKGSIAVAMVLAVAAALVALPAIAADPVEIPLTLEKAKWDPDTIKVKAGTPFTLVITNKDKGPEEFDMLQPRIEKVIPAGKTVKLKMPALKPGTYPFVGEYH